MPDDVIMFGDEPEQQPVKRRRLSKEFGTPQDEAEANDRNMRTAHAALALAFRHVPDQDIAEQLGYSTAAAARLAWERALVESMGPNPDFTAIRGVAKGRMEMVMGALVQDALKPYTEVVLSEGEKPVTVPNPQHNAAATLYLRYLDRWIRLQGADAPQVVEVRTPSSIEMEQVIQTLILERGDHSAGAEADILADEYVIEEEPDDGTDAE